MARILLVDDECPVRRVCAIALIRAGHDVVEAENGDEATRLLNQRRARFDLLLTDIVMPGLSGLELGRRVHILHPGLPVLLMTAFCSEMFESSRPLQFPLLEKPFTPSDLLGAVEQLLRSSHAEGRW